MPRRMLNGEITNSGDFLTMPISSQALYFHLCINADDDGAVDAYKLLKLGNFGDDDIKVLYAKKYIYKLESNYVYVITDWKEHNLIRKDRYIPSRYRNEIINIIGKGSLMYPEIKSLKDRPIRADLRRKLIGAVDGEWTAQGQHSIGKDSIGKDRLVKDIYISVLEHWNSKNIINHTLQGTIGNKIQKAVDKRLKDGTLEDIKKAIDNYFTVLMDDKYYWTHRWTLPDFLARGYDKFIDQAKPLDNFLKSGVKVSKNFASENVDRFANL